MEVKEKLLGLRIKRGETWKELAAALHVSEGCLFSLISGRRNASNRLTKKIVDLEEGKPILNTTSHTVVKESSEPYMSTKRLNMLELDHRLSTISAEVAAIRELLKEARDE